MARHIPDSHRCDLLPSGSAWSRCVFLSLLAVASLHYPHCSLNLVLSHSTYGVDLCGSNETLLALLGFIVIQVMRWPWTGCHPSSLIQVICILRLRSQLGHLSAPLASPTLAVPLPVPHFSGYLFFRCYLYQDKNLTNLAYQPDVLRLWCDSVQNSSYVFTHKHNQWTRRQWREYATHHGDCKTLRSQPIGRSLTKQVPIPHGNALVLFWFEQS